MPVYEYACAVCGKVTEAIRPMIDADAPLRCEHCDSTKTTRQHSTFKAQASQPASTSAPWAGGGGGGGGGCGCGNPHGPCAG